MDIYKQKLYSLMNETTGMFHAFDSGEYQSRHIREIIENLAHENNGKLFYYSLNINSIRMTYTFENYAQNLIFRYELTKLRISYQSTGYKDSTYIVCKL